MFGFLVKLLLFVAIIGGIGYVVYSKKANLPGVKAELVNTIQNFDSKKVSDNLSAALDSLVVNKQSNSPVVLGVQISNDSIGKLVDVIQNLPPEQVNQVKSILCEPVATSSSR